MLYTLVLGMLLRDNDHELRMRYNLYYLFFYGPLQWDLARMWSSLRCFLVIKSIQVFILVGLLFELLMSKARYKTKSVAHLWDRLAN